MDHTEFLRALADLAQMRFEEHKHTAGEFVDDPYTDFPLGAVTEARHEELHDHHIIMSATWNLVAGLVQGQLAKSGTPYVPKANDRLIFPNTQGWEGHTDNRSVQ